MKKILSRSLLILAVAALVAPAAFAQNTLAVNNAAALNGTNFGLEVSMDGSTNSVFVAESDLTNDESIYRASFWVDFNAIDIDPGQRFAAVFVRNAAGLNIGRFQMARRSDDGSYRVRYQHRNSVGDFVGTQLNGNGKRFIDVSGGPLFVTLEVTIGNGSTGRIEITVDDGGTETNHFRGPFGNLPNGNIEEVRAGGRGLGPQVVGSYYFDEFESFRTLAGS